MAILATAELTILAPVDGGPHHIPTVMWPPAGITFVLIWRYGRAGLLGALAGVFLFVAYQYSHVFFGAVGALNHVLPLAYACWQMRRNGIDDPFATPRGVGQFVFFAVLMAPMISATLGIVLALLAPSTSLEWHFSAWLALWANEAIALALITPVLLRLNDLRNLSRATIFELCAIVCAVIVIWSQLFLSNPQEMALPLTILTTPFLLVTAFRYSFGIVASFSLLASFLSLVSPVGLPYGTPRQSYFFTLGYLATLGLSNIAIGAGSAALRATLSQLTQREKLLRGMFDHAAVGLMLHDLQKNTRTFNSRARDLLGYPTQSIDEVDLPKLTFPEEQRVTAELMGQLRRHEIDSFNQEKRYVRADNEVIWVSLTMSILRDEKGIGNYFIGVFQDITPRKRVEKRFEGQTHILHALAADAGLTDLLHDIALFAEELWPSSRCGIYLTDNREELLRVAAAPSCPADASAPAVSMPIDDGLNPTASAATRKRDVICEDMLREAGFAALRPVIETQPWRRAWWAVPFFATNGELFGVLNFYFDRPRLPTAEDDEIITMLASLAGIVVQHHRDEEKLRDSEQRFRITFEQAAVGVALLDKNGKWLQVNQKFCEIVGYSQEELLQTPYARLVAPEDQQLTLQASMELMQNNTTQVQIDHRYMRKNGDIIWVNSQFSVARTASGEVDYRIAVIKDITERKQAEAEVERLALYDYLTGLPNRRLFGDRLRTAVMAAKRSERYGAVIYIDLDNFKQLNDTYGHNAGDDFLKMVAHRLQRNLREEDTVARLGGDEFVILLQNVSDSMSTAATATASIAEKIQSALSEPFILPNGVEHIVTSSLGITLFPKDAENAEDLLKEADIAMYRVKEAQRNAMRFYEPAMKAEVDSRLALERALRRALHDDEFELFLQPQFDASRSMVSCETLLRWPQPDGSFISPNEFIPIAEETGLIVPLGEWVLRRAGQLMHALELAGYTVSLCINVSPRQFSEPNFVERVRTILWESGADAGRIVLEITEGVVVADFDDVRTKMLALQQMGIRLSVDDFGTGHSSLAYLKLLPLHELKIDRAFVYSLPDDANDIAIVEAVLSVAQHLQLEVVAEGVETNAQLEFLKARGCQRFQGYLLARPALPHQHFPGLGDFRQRRREV